MIWNLNLYILTSMAVKKIIQNAFEQIAETGRDMAKSSVKQVADTLSPWDMIRNSFGDEKGVEQNQNQNTKSKELHASGTNSTPLDLPRLANSYAEQDKKRISDMQQRLFQLAKGNEEKNFLRGKQEKNQKKQTEMQKEAGKRNENLRKQQTGGAIPESKAGRGGKKKRKATEPQPAETKPGSSKQ